MLFRLAAVCASLLFAGPAVAKSGSEYFRLTQYANEQIAAGDYEKAYSSLADATQIYDQDAEILILKARLAHVLGQHEHAVTAFESAFALGVLYPASNARRAAESYAALGDKEKMLAWLRRALDNGYAQRLQLYENKAFSEFQDDPDFLKLVGKAVTPVRSRTDRWRRDIDFLVSEAQRIHAAPERPAYSQGFIHAAETLKSRVSKLDDTELFLELTKLTVLLGDGHTFIAPRPPSKLGANPVVFDARSLPVKFHLFGDKLHIIDASDGFRQLIGAEVTSIGGKTIDEYFDLAKPYTHRDNSESYRFLFVHFRMAHFAINDALRVAKNGVVPIEAVLMNGEKISADLPPGDHSFPRKLRPMPGQETYPAFLSDVDTLYHERYFPEHGAYYIRINNIRDGQEEGALSDFVSSAIDTAKGNNAHAVIVDLRLNNGGNNSLCHGLVAPLIGFEQSRATPPRKIFIITRHETFSAAQNCSNKIEQMTDAIFVGEPSSSSPNFTGEETEVILPYSGAAISISNNYWQDSGPYDQRGWIAPDIPAPLTFQDYVSGRDPALESIFEILE